MQRKTGSRHGLSIIGFLICLTVLNGCSSHDVAQYEGREPVLDVKQFFSGKLSAHGVVKNRSGAVIRHFNAEILATWDQHGTGTLDETFLFNDGEQQKRIWILRPSADGAYIASANDVVGESPLSTAGNGLFLNYVLQIPYKDGTTNVKVDDRMFLVNESTIINESVLKKFGFRVASVSLVIVKH